MDGRRTGGQSSAGNAKRYEVQEMWQLHHEITRLALLGWKQAEIARKLSCTAATVSNVLNSRIVKDKLDMLRARRDASAVDVASAIQDLAPKAVSLMAMMIDVEEETGAAKFPGITPNVQLAAARDLLDRAGYGAVKKLQTENVHAHLSMDEVEEIKSRARHAAKAQGLLVEIEDGPSGA